MKYKLISLLTVITWMIFIQGNLFAQETDVKSAVLTMKTFGAIAAGTVDPSEIWTVYQSGEVVNISASPNTGFTFSSWTVTGQGTLADSIAATTTVTLSGNCIVTANFIKTDNSLTGQLTVTVSPDASGTVTPAIETAINIGAIQAITATPTGTYKFLKWSIEGAATLDNVYSANTNTIIRGDVTLTANFAETADTVELILEPGAVDAGGTILNAGTYNVEQGSTRRIKAIPESGYIFTGWLVNGLAVLDSENSPETDIAVYEDTTVSANFATSICSYSHQSRQITIKKTDGSSGYTKNKDSVNIKALPMCLNSNDFNPTTDTIQVFIDGTTLTINKNKGRFTRNPNGYKYRSFTKNGASPAKLILDFTKGVWSLKASGINLEQLDTSDGVTVMLYANGNYYGQKYDMEEKVTWNFSITKNTEEPINSPGTDMETYKISKIRGNYRNDQNAKDSLVISKAVIKLPTGTTFDPATQIVTLNLGDESIIIPAGSFEETKENNFLYNNKEQKIRLTLDFAKETWSLNYKKFSGWSNIDPNEGLKVYLNIGAAQSGLNIIPSFRRTLKYNYKKFYWRK